LDCRGLCRQLFLSDFVVLLVIAKSMALENCLVSGLLAN